MLKEDDGDAVFLFDAGGAVCSSVDALHVFDDGATCVMIHDSKFVAFLSITRSYSVQISCLV